MLLESSFSQLKKSLARPLRDGESPNELSGRVAHVEACLRESKRFLHDLDWLARTGGVEMAPGRVELSAVVDEVLFEQRELLARHNVAVDVRRPLPVVWCNEGRLKQIVTNLVRNAVHHGCHPQYPRITIAPCADSRRRRCKRGQRDGGVSDSRQRTGHPAAISPGDLLAGAKAGRGRRRRIGHGTGHRQEDRRLLRWLGLRRPRRCRRNGVRGLAARAGRPNVGAPSRRGVPVRGRRPHVEARTRRPAPTAAGKAARHIVLTALPPALIAAALHPKSFCGKSIRTLGHMALPSPFPRSSRHVARVRRIPSRRGPAATIGVA